MARSGPAPQRSTAKPRVAGPKRIDCMANLPLIASNDLPRIRLVLDGPLEHDASIDDFLRRVLDECVDTGTRRLAAIRLLHMQAGSLDADEEEALHRIVLASAWQEGDEAWLRSAVNLAQVYRGAGRQFECIVLARRAAAVAGDHLDGLARAAAHMHLASCLGALEDIPRQTLALDAFEEALDAARLTGRHRVLRCTLYSMRASVEAQHGHLEAALEWLRAQERIHVTLPGVGSAIAELHMQRAIFLTMLGRVERAKASLTAARACGLERPDYLVLQATVETQYALQADGPKHAVPQARAALELLEPGALPIGHGVRLKFASQLGRLLMDECDAFQEGRRAFDLAATAALGRIRELDGVLDDLPAGAAPSREDFKILADFRRRFTQHQKELFALVAEKLRAGMDDLGDLVVSESMIALCAWCQRVRSAQTGKWLPIGHYVPAGDQFALTHGICPGCRDAEFEGL